MSSKLIKSGAVIEPIRWSSAGGGTSSVVSAPAAERETLEPSLEQKIAEIERSAEARVSAAYQEGIATGRAAGAQQAAARLDPVLAKLAATIGELTSMRPSIRSEAEQDIVRLAVAIARRVLHREVSQDPEALLGIVKAALDRIEMRELHRVRLHPEDAPAIQRYLTAAGAPARVEIQADPSLERGSAILETTRGNLDASVSTQLGEIERGLADLVRRQQ